MLLKQLDRTATTAFGPVSLQTPSGGAPKPLLAVGSVSGAMDLSFSSRSELELFAVDLDEGSVQGGLTRLGSVVSSAARFHRLAWSPWSARSSTDRPWGLLAGAMDDGSLSIWNPHALVPELNAQQAQEALVFSKVVHTGNFRALDFNPFQANLLATGASSAEIFIWDMNNLGTPYGPGQKSQRLDEITSLAWNRQVQHILASASNSGCCSIWDLKMRREIIGLTSPTRRPFTAIAWNPDLSTQILTASDDDQDPVIYMWDLRNANAPERTLKGHDKGVLSLSWCPKDSGLLLSSGKDNRVLCWDPASGDVMGEFPHSKNWTFDVQWCAKHPDLLSTASFDGKINIYSIQAKAESNEIPLSPRSEAKSDPFAVKVPQPKPFTLKKPPQWLRRPIGAQFAYGNKLVSFSSLKSKESRKNQRVVMHQVTADPVFAQQCQQLHASETKEQFAHYCEEQIAHAGTNENEKSIWNFMKMLLENDAREQIVSLLGFSKEELTAKLSSMSIGTKKSPAAAAAPPPPVAEVVASNEETPTNGTHPDSADFFAGSAATDFPVIQDQGSNALPGAPVKVTPVKKPFMLFKNNVKDDLEGLITSCLIVGDFAGAVDICLENNRLDDALMMASCGGPELLAQTRDAYFERKSAQSSYLRLLSSIVQHDFMDIVNNSNVEQCWKEVLAILCSYAPVEEFSKLANALGNRLRSSSAQKDQKNGQTLLHASVLCYMASGNLEQLVKIWSEQKQHQLQMVVGNFQSQYQNLASTKKFAHLLRSFIDKVTVFRQAVQFDDTDQDDLRVSLKPLYKEYAVYSGLLIEQGLLASALKYLDLTNGFRVPLGQNVIQSLPGSPLAAESSSFDLLQIHKERLYQAIGQSEAQKIVTAIPTFPYEQVKVLPDEPPQPDFLQKPSQKQPEKRAVAPAAAIIPPSTTTAPSSYQPNPSAGYSNPSAYAPQPSMATTGYPTQPNMATTGYPTQPNMATTGYPSQPTMAQPSYGGYPTQPNPPAPSYGGYPAPSAGASYPNTSYPNPPTNQPAQSSGYPQTAPSYNAPGAQPMNGSMYGGAYGGSQSNLPGQYSGYPAQPNSYGQVSQPAVPKSFIPTPPSAISNPQPGPSPMAPNQVPTSPPIPSASTIPASKMGGFNDPPSDIFKPKAPSKKASTPGLTSFPQQPGFSGVPPGGPPQQFADLNRPPSQMGLAPPSAPGYGYPNQQMSPISPPAEPEKKRHPTGDRTHILPEHHPIYDVLFRCLNGCKPNANPPQKKFLDDAEKRLNALFDRLNNQEVAPAAIEQLLQLAKAVSNKDWDTALNIQQILLTSHAAEGTNWIIGLKRLLDTARTLM